jgi:hypothetical protein
MVNKYCGAASKQNLSRTMPPVAHDGWDDLEGLELIIRPCRS